MALSGIRKAAMLLMNLDSASAEKLLEGQPEEVVQELAMELAQLEKTKVDNNDSVFEVTKEFCVNLEQGQVRPINVKSFVNTMLKSNADKEKAQERHEQMQKALQEKDPFMAISSASPSQIATAVEREPPQAIALVLSNLPPKLSTDVLARLPQEMSTRVVWRMTKPSEVSPKTLRRIGEMVCKRLVELTSEDGAPAEEVLPKQALRKVALVLSGLNKEKRDEMLGEIEDNDEDVAKMVRALMVTWEDIPKIEDRSLQEALRNVEAGVLAKALFNAETSIVEKIRNNISERAAEMVDEEAGLIGEPRKKEVEEAREEVAKPLREANEREELAFIEE
jgi:flagellar motor switch protein FliG